MGDQKKVLNFNNFASSKVLNQGDAATSTVNNGIGFVDFGESESSSQMPVLPDLTSHIGSENCVANAAQFAKACRAKALADVKAGLTKEIAGALNKFEYKGHRGCGGPGLPSKTDSNVLIPFDHIGDSDNNNNNNNKDKIVNGGASGMKGDSSSLLLENNDQIISKKDSKLSSNGDLSLDLENAHALNYYLVGNDNVNDDRKDYNSDELIRHGLPSQGMNNSSINIGKQVGCYAREPTTKEQLQIEHIKHSLGKKVSRQTMETIDFRDNYINNNNNNNTNNNNVNKRGQRSQSVEPTVGSGGGGTLATPWPDKARKSQERGNGDIEMSQTGVAK